MTSSFPRKMRVERNTIFFCRVVEAAIDAGATTVNIPDTVGYATPNEIYDRFKMLRQSCPQHRQGCCLARIVMMTLGLGGCQFSLAAVAAGAGQIECTVNGIGERAGNAALEEVVMALKTRSDFYRCGTPRSSRRVWCRPAVWSARQRAFKFNGTKRSWVVTLSRMKRASTRTECSRNAALTKSCCTGRGWVLEDRFSAGKTQWARSTCRPRQEHLAFTLTGEQLTGCVRTIQSCSPTRRRKSTTVTSWRWFSSRSAAVWTINSGLWLTIEVTSGKHREVRTCELTLQVMATTR